MKSKNLLKTTSNEMRQLVFTVNKDQMPSEVFYGKFVQRKETRRYHGIAGLRYGERNSAGKEPANLLPSHRTAIATQLL